MQSPGWRMAAELPAQHCTWPGLHDKHMNAVLVQSRLETKVNVGDQHGRHSSNRKSQHFLVGCVVILSVIFTASSPKHNRQCCQGASAEWGLCDGLRGDKYLVSGQKPLANIGNQYRSRSLEWHVALSKHQRVASGSNNLSTCRGNVVEGVLFPQILATLKANAFKLAVQCCIAR